MWKNYLVVAPFFGTLSNILINIYTLDGLGKVATVKLKPGRIRQIHSTDDGASSSGHRLHAWEQTLVFLGLTPHWTIFLVDLTPLSNRDTYPDGVIHLPVLREHSMGSRVPTHISSSYAMCQQSGPAFVFGFGVLDDRAGPRETLGQVMVNLNTDTREIKVFGIPPCAGCTVGTDQTFGNFAVLDTTGRVYVVKDGEAYANFQAVDVPRITGSAHLDQVFVYQQKILILKTTSGDGAADYARKLMCTDFNGTCKHYVYTPHTSHPFVFVFQDPLLSLIHI